MTFPDFDSWRNSFWGHQQASLDKTRADLANALWRQRGAPFPSQGEDDKNDYLQAGELLHKANVLNDPEAIEKVCQLWRSRFNAKNSP